MLFDLFKRGNFESCWGFSKQTQSFSKCHDDQIWLHCCTSSFCFRTLFCLWCFKQRKAKQTFGLWNKCRSPPETTQAGREKNLIPCDVFEALAPQGFHQNCLIHTRDSAPIHGHLVQKVPQMGDSRELELGSQLEYLSPDKKRSPCFWRMNEMVGQE